MAIATNLGFPRIGPRRELKRAVEAYWADKVDRDELNRIAASLRRENWDFQRHQGIRHIPSNDFSLYDHVLDTAVMVGAVPERFGHPGGPSTSTSTSPWPAGSPAMGQSRACPPWK